MSEHLRGPAVEFPLRGEWTATNTPAERVPSHGTDWFGQRYAFDFVRMDPTGTWFHDGGGAALARHLTTGLDATRFFGWDQPIHAAFAGRVLAARDGAPDARQVRLVWDRVRGLFARDREPTRDDYRPLAGNYVLVEGAEGVALYAHLRQGSVRAEPGQRIAAGTVLGAVGNSGNSTMPHLHFHLMDGADAFTARGLPCTFRRYERWVDGRWEVVEHGVPGSFERIRAG